MMRPRGNKRGATATAGAASAGTPPEQRTTQVRNRLVAAVAVVGVAVLAAGAPGIATGSRDLSESQRLVSLSELNGQAVGLAHSLADERDTMTEFVAAGRTTASGAAGVSESRRARVDRQVSEIRAEAPAGLKRALAELPKMRQEALSGRGRAADTFQSYTEAVRTLHAVSADLGRRIPPRASGGPAEGLPFLGRAVEQASATRALALGALSAGGSQPQLIAAAQRSRVQEQAALADFDQTAPEAHVDRYSNTVNGTEISTAERYLTRLTDQPQLSSSDTRLDRDRVEASLSSRIDRMRAVESALTTTETKRLAALRDNDVTALELGIALVGFCLLLAIGISMSAARSMTRPLAVLRLGAQRLAADPVEEEPVRFTGRNDEFADAVRAINELRETAVRLHGRAGQLGDDRTRLVGERKRLADERTELLAVQKDLNERLTGLQDRVHGSYVNLALRTLTLVERQLGVIEGLEDREEDPERLDTLFKLDHLATRMRRHSENLLVLAGAEHSGGHAGPVPLLDVLRASISEIERYERVQIHSLPPHAQVAGFAADAVSHLVAELLENATAFSPPDVEVQLSGWLLESGEVMLSVLDEGIGMTTERLEQLNARLADPRPQDGHVPGEDDALGLGLYVVARLAARHGVRVQVREQKQGGVAAVVVLPKSILPARPAPSGSGVRRSSGGAPAVSLPGSVAEANSNALPRRSPAPIDSQLSPGREPQPTPPGAGEAPAAEPAQDTAPTDAALIDSAPTDAGPDPLVEAAERAVAAAESDQVPEPEPWNGGTGGTGDTAASEDPYATTEFAAAGPYVTTEFAAAGPYAAAEPTAPGLLPEESPEELPGSGEPGTGPVPADGFTETPESAGGHGPQPDPEPAFDGFAPAAGPGSEPGGQVFPPRDGDKRQVSQDEDPLAVPGRPARPAAESPYAIGPEQHTRSEDGSTVGKSTDQPTHPIRVPRQGGVTPAVTADLAEPARTDPARTEPATEPAHAEPAPDGEQTPDGGPAQANAPKWERITDKGLPKRTPKATAPAEPRHERSKSVDADALRRKLGGFQQGALNGRRDAEAEAEVAESAGDHHTGALDEGGTVEEARG
ncbi:nitrate- and nitrite sensing domain-containing protein [Streptomyces sp. NPDC004647]|uniref:sensor histidine kinase n=1 Tax=Streptomyces sp. NPDC004647 TaxID=3154671 RepID=UPI0033B89AC0